MEALVAGARLGRSTVQEISEGLLQAAKAFKAISFKHEATPLTAFAGSLVGLGGMQLAQMLVQQLAAPDAMVLIGSSAALCTLLFAAPAAPLGMPYNTILGHAVSIGIALCFHWLALALQLDAQRQLWAHVLAPSISIGVMTRFKITNPPAAAAAFIFLTSDNALSQPFAGAFFLLAPALVGCAWALFVQWALVRTLAWLNQRSSTGANAAPTKAKAAIIVDTVDPAATTCIMQAVEGAAYVDDPLSYVIETLTQDPARMNKKAASVLVAFDSRPMGRTPSTADTMAGIHHPQLKREVSSIREVMRDEAAIRIQRRTRKLMTAKKIASPVDARLMV